LIYLGSLFKTKRLPDDGSLSDYTLRILNLHFLLIPVPYQYPDQVQEVHHSRP
jgi:hypothetical protein